MLNFGRDLKIKKRVHKREESKNNPKRIKRLDIRTNNVNSMSKSLPIKTRLALDKPKLQKPALLYNPWTEHEMEWLVVGVNRYGNKWRDIHDAFNFHPSRTLKALAAKFLKMSRNGEFEKYLKNFRRKAGYKDVSTSDDFDDTPLPQKSDLIFSPKSSKGEISASTPIQEIQICEESPVIQPATSSGETLNESTRTKKQAYALWSQSETDYLEEGFKIYGPQWKRILQTYPFNPSRKTRYLRDKFRRLHPDFKRSDVTPENETNQLEFAQERGDPYFLSPTV